MIHFNTAYNLLVVTGPTASGKTKLAVTVAKHMDGEIISADSRQVYKGMDIGTGKDYDDYILDGVSIPCHLMDIAEPGYKYNVFEYQRDFLKIYEDLKIREVFPIVSGGSGMYVDSIISGYRMFEVAPDNELRSMLEKKSIEELREILLSFKSLHNSTDTDSKKRLIRAIEIEHFTKNHQASRPVFPKLKSLVVGVSVDRETRRKRISERLHCRLENGMVDEIRKLIEKGVRHETLLYYGLEYKYVTLYLMGSISREEMIHDLEIAIHQFAKRQMTWFRGMERRGININWIDGLLPMEEKVGKIIKLLEGQPT
jgi:tRNA dimethylallyltransferase